MKRRSHKTRWIVRVADKVATACITVGGIGTILAVTGVFLFLVSVVVPVFRSGHAEPHADQTPHLPAPALNIGTAEYRVCGWSLGRDGVWRAFRLDNGDTLSSHVLAPADSFSVSSFDAESASLAVGLTDGSIRLFRIAWESDYPDAAMLATAPEHIGEHVTVDGAVIELTPEGSLRRQRAALTELGRIPAGITVVRALSH